MVKLAMGIWAGIAAASVLLVLMSIPILGCLFSRSKKGQNSADMEEWAAEKEQIIVEAAPAPTRPENAILQKPAFKVSQHEIGVRTTPSTQSMSPSYQSQASILSPTSPLRNTPSPPHMQPI